MSRLELIAVFTALQCMNDKGDHEGVAKVLEEVLKEAKRKEKKDDD